MKQNEHKRLDHLWLWPWQFVNENYIKALRRVIHDRAKKRQRRRDKEAIQEGLDDV